MSAHAHDDGSDDAALSIAPQRGYRIEPRRDERGHEARERRRRDDERRSACERH